MRIEIDYDGSVAACKVNGKLFDECSNIDKVFAMDAFRTIRRHYQREVSAEKLIEILKKNGKE